jgi:hypothetical protein
MPLFVLTNSQMIAVMGVCKQLFLEINFDWLRGSAAFSGGPKGLE